MQGRHPRPSIAVSPTSRRHATGAITWIDRDGALIARRGGDGTIDVTAVRRAPGEASPFLARVAHEIGDRDRVVIMGPGPTRTELEREYVAVYHRPDRLVDVEPAGEMSETDLLDRLHELAD
jgi:hypothetical protein